MLLQTISPQLTPDVAAQVEFERARQEGFATVVEFLQIPQLAGLGVSEAGLGVQSAYFEVRVQARFMDRYAYLTSVIQRIPTDGRMRVVYRNVSGKVRFDPPDETIDNDA